MTSLEFRDRLARRARRAKAPLTLAMLGPLEAYFRVHPQFGIGQNDVWYQDTTVTVPATTCFFSYQCYI